jgi:hypothetical protein
MDILIIPTRYFPLLYRIKPIPNQRCSTGVSNLRGVGGDDEGQVETMMAEPKEAGEDAPPAATQGMEEDAPVLACSAREWTDWRWRRRRSAGGLQVAGVRHRIPSPATARDCWEDAAAAAPRARLGGCAGVGAWGSGNGEVCQRIPSTPAARYCREDAPAAAAAAVAPARNGERSDRCSDECKKMFQR